MTNTFNIEDFGAISDGKTDCTKAIQKTIDAAALNGGVVLVPSASYLTGKIILKPHVTIKGDVSWSYRNDGGSTLILNNENDKCLIDASGAYGATISSLCLNGKWLGKAHGVQINYEKGNPRIEEDTLTIDGCKISHFNKCGIYLNHVWCFSIRHSMISDNIESGLYIKGWDGFILDNWFSGNREYGVYSDEECSSITMTSNRVEWNFLAGFRLMNPININITGNYFDASGGPALDLANPKGKRAINVTVTGNIFHRSGMKALSQNKDVVSAHIDMERCMNVIVTSNVFYYGIDDNGNAQFLCPDIGIQIKKLKNCVIKDNALDKCATKAVLIDNGMHEGGNAIELNGTYQNHLDEFWYPFFKD